MDRELAIVSNGLDDKNPSVCAAKAAADGADKADVIARRDIILRQQLGPTRITLHAFPRDHRGEEVCFEQARACSPDVEIPISAGFEHEEHANKETDQHHG